MSLDPSQVPLSVPMPFADPGTRPTGARPGSVRVRVRGTDPSTPGFVSVAPAADADALISRVRHSRRAELVDPAIDSVQHPGVAPVSPPDNSVLWVAQVSGHGTAELIGPEQQGLGRLLLRSADGPAGMSVPTDSGASLPVQRLVGRWLLDGAVPLAVVGSVLVWMGARRPRQTMDWRSPAEADAS